MSKTVVLTSSDGSFPGLVAALQELSVRVEERPLLTFAPPSDWSSLDTALAILPTYRSIALTSPRAARAFAERIRTRKPMLAFKERPRVWASGTSTAEPLEDILGPVRLAPEKAVGTAGAGRALARAMLEAGARGPVLFPCGEAHREELPAELRAAGLVVEEVDCYRSLLASETQARAAAQQGNVIVVSSPKVADLLARSCPGSERPELLAVGPTTAESARAGGWSPAAVAPEPTARGVAAAVRALLRSR
jgi:uroporphyrinogen-III synthase